MRKIDENRAKNYITKHERYRKWLVFALCISLLTGTATLYMLNKPATAMTEEALSTMGIVTPTADAQFEQELIQQTQENKENQEVEEEQGDPDETVVNSADGEDGNSDGDDSEETSNPDEENNESDDELTDEEKAELEAEKEAKEAEEKLKNTEAAELSADVVLTVSYVDENGDALADDKEISLTDSIDFTSEAREIEGYTFKEATIDGAVITVITAKQDADEHKYYEVTLKGGDVAEIKEDKTVVLTYTSEEAEEEEVLADAESVKLTARYVDKDGTEIQEAAELNVTKEIEFNEEYEELIDGYFYEGVFLEESEIAKITPVVEEKAADKAETAEQEADEADEESDESEETTQTPEVTVTGYDITTKGGEVISVTEDTEITFKYLKACEETEFTFEDSKITVKITTTRGGVFPEGIQLKVAELTPESENYNYDAYLDALNENSEAIANESGKDDAEMFSEDNTLMYDIAFIYEDMEIQPREGSVIVTMEFKDQQLSEGLAAESDEDLAVVHLPIKEEVKEATEIATTEEATDITSGDIKVETLTDASAEVGDEQKVEFTSDSFSVFAVISYQKHEPGTDTFKSVLGDAVNFGITAYQISVNESETNFAAKMVYANAQTGNDMTNPSEQTFIAAAITGTFQLKGEDAYFMVPSQYRHNVTHQSGADHIKLDTTYTEAELGGVVDDMMTYVRNASADLATRTANAKIVKTGNDRYKVDISSYPAGTYYVTVTDNDLAKIGAAERLTINKKSDQTIVFNVTSGGEVNLHKYMVSTDGGAAIGSDTLAGTREDKTARTIIWNFPNANSVHSADGVAGVFISGQQYATWTNDSTSGGWLAFPNVVIKSEFHNTYDEVQQISGTAQFQAYKNVDGQPSKVSGFKFTLYKWENNGWTEVETVKNTEESPEFVTFSSIGFGNEADKKNRPNYQYTTLGVGETGRFIYAIVESAGSADSEGNAYTPDSTAYYVTVDVTCQKLNEFTDTTFYRVSAPTYYSDNYLSQKITGVPTFNNRTQNGVVGISLYKYLNGGDPGDQKFGFTVRKILSNGSIQTVSNAYTNDGKNINFAVNYTSNDLYRYNNSTGYSEGKLCLIITENDITNSTGSDVKKDGGYILVRVDNPGTEKQVVNYYRLSEEQAKNNVNISRIESYDSNYGNKGTYFEALAKGDTYKINPADYEEKLAFFNTGGGQLRIHKMVVNDFGSDFVRNKTNAAILQTIVFRITNLDTGNYLTFTGFVDTSNRDRTFTDISGKSYKVTYNNNAQWTISGLAAGRYQVEEVADGVTLGYDAGSNSSYIVESSPLSRVTKYDVTTDSNTGKNNYGTGGQNLRKVYSKDLLNHYDSAPEAHVGDEIQTVQVCNYYSIPVGPIEISKNFIGGVWGSDKSFTFRIEADTEKGFRAWDSSNATVSLANQPMPENTEVTITGDGVNNTQIASFGSIPFRFEGNYNYKISEVQGDTPGVKYDNTVYYVEIQVRKKYTQFQKTYTGENMANPENYSKNTNHTETEDFFYLGADIYYRDSEGNTLAVCTLTLPANLATFENAQYNFDIAWANTNGVHDVAFNNTLSGNLTVSKEWIDMSGNVNNNGHSALPLDIWQRTVGSSEWKLYTETTVVLSSDNNWTQTVTGLPLRDEAGNAYEYCVKESDSFLATYAVVYKFNGQEYFAEDQKTTTVGGVETKDTGYSMTFNEQTASFGNVVISNRNVVSNVIPSTGGMGTTCYAAIGALLVAIAFAGMMLYRRRKSF